MNAPPAPAGPRGGGDAPHSIRVATFNIRNGRAFDGRRSWPFRRTAVAAAIAGLGADVVGLQEVYAFQLRSLSRRLPAMTSAGAGRTNGRRGERCVVMLRSGAVALSAHRTCWYGPDPDRPGGRLPGAGFPRVATICRVETSAVDDRRIDVESARFEVANTHLDERSSDNRRRSAEQLLGWLDPALPRIVLGDLNAEPDDPVLRVFEAAGFRSVLPANAGGTAHQFTGRTDGPRIDHVLVSSEWAVVDAAVVHPRPGGRLPSDHWPVVATLRLDRA